jgi:ppGpp synthetase/RelA/SpoT-type nucleotidyltranferase
MRAAHRDGPLTSDELEQAEATVAEFRQQHARPTSAIAAELTIALEALELPHAVGSRLKELPSILLKLHRMGSTRLTQVDDIGGCRVVLETGAALQSLLEHSCQAWGEEVRSVLDRVAAPNTTGYRAVHVIVRRDQCFIEVQLRTPGQQVWADHVEELDDRFGTDLKHGEGPEVLKGYLLLLSDVLHANEYGPGATARQRNELTKMRNEVEASGYSLP